MSFGERGMWGLRRDRWTHLTTHVLSKTCLALVLVSGWALEAEAANSRVPPISQTLLPEGDLSVGLRPSLLLGEDLDENNRLTQFATSFVPDVQLGLTKNLQLGILPFGVAYRFDEPFGMKTFEVIPAVTLNPGFSTTELTGFGVSFTAQASLDVRQWINRRGAITLGGGGGSPISYQAGSDKCPPTLDICDNRVRVFEYWFFAGTGGITQSIGRFTFAIGATLAYTMRFGSVSPSTSVFTIGSRVRHGILSDPLIRFHATDSLSLDAHAQYTRFVAESTGFGLVSLGVNYVF